METRAADWPTDNAKMRFKSEAVSAPRASRFQCPDYTGGVGVIIGPRWMDKKMERQSVKMLVSDLPMRRKDETMSS